MDSKTSHTGRVNRVGGGSGAGNSSEAPDVTSERPPNAYAKMRRNAASLLTDAVRLLDLQLQLLAVDARAFLQKAKLGLCGIAISAAITLSATTLLMFSLGTILQTQWGISQELSYASVAGTGLAIAGLGFVISLRSLKRAEEKLQRSYGEFQNNLDWLRSAISQDEES